MSEPFSLPGDSGALVFTNNRRVVGMVFGGIVNESVSYVSHVEDLFPDIKEWANGEDIRVMEKKVGEREDGGKGNEGRDGDNGEGRGD